MPVTPSFPGLYIEELPLSAHSISAAPTSITVIVGYTHPFKTDRPGEAVRLFSFTDFEREFGGMFASGLIESHVPQAVNQFFLNGGSDLYVVGLTPKIVKPPGTTAVPYTDATAQPTIGIPTDGSNKIVFNALEPTDLVDMTVSLGNIRKSPGQANLDTFDLTVAYGRRVETYRGLTINPAAKTGRQLYSINGQSSLVAVADANGLIDNTAVFGIAFPAGTTIVKTLSKPAGFITGFDAQQFVDVFQANTSLDKVSIFNILLTPGIFDNTVNSAAVAFGERKRAFVILDAPQDAAADDGVSGVLAVNDPSILGAVPLSENGALYFPYLRSIDPVTGTAIEVAPSGFIAGVYARTDQRRGVWKAPAGIEATLINTTGVVARGDMNNEQQGVLYGVITQTVPINCLRSFPGAGTVVFGARTVVGSNQAFNQSKYVPVRRMTLFIEQTLLANLTWVVFEPNDEPLWISIRTSIESFMLSLFNQGALQGKKPSDAFQVKCDSSTTTQDDVNNGIVNVVVAFAPLKPAEFVIIKIAQLAGQTQTS
jgi:phage tail sheath protein FI